MPQVRLHNKWNKHFPNIQSSQPNTWQSRSVFLRSTWKQLTKVGELPVTAQLAGNKGRYRSAVIRADRRLSAGRLVSRREKGWSPQGHPRHGERVPAVSLPVPRAFSSCRNVPSVRILFMPRVGGGILFLPLRAWNGLGNGKVRRRPISWILGSKFVLNFKLLCVSFLNSFCLRFRHFVAYEWT